MRKRIGIPLSIFVMLVLAILIDCFGGCFENKKGDSSTYILETTTTTTTEQTTTTTTASQTTEQTTESTTTTTTAAVSQVEGLKDLGSFKGTYYISKRFPCSGGSGRTLYGCDIKEDSYKGSIASRYIFENYGYNVNLKTMVYIEVKEYPKMNGWYSVDDCNKDKGVVDFYFQSACHCPFRTRGVVSVRMYIP